MKYTTSWIKKMVKTSFINDGEINEIEIAFDLRDDTVQVKCDEKIPAVALTEAISYALYANVGEYTLENDPTPNRLGRKQRFCNSRVVKPESIEYVCSEEIPTTEPYYEEGLFGKKTQRGYFSQIKTTVVFGEIDGDIAPVVEKVNREVFMDMLVSMGYFIVIDGKYEKACLPHTPKNYKYKFHSPVYTEKIDYGCDGWTFDEFSEPYPLVERESIDICPLGIRSQNKCN